MTPEELNKAFDKIIADLQGAAMTKIMGGAAVEAMTEISPISDARGSAEYKRLLLRQLIYAHFLKLFPEIIKPEDLL